jgi:hypothetical protein
MRPNRKPLPKVKTGEPKFLYVSTCCGERAIKEPCMAVDKKSALTQGLGTFRCPKCHKACKCGRSKNGEANL